MAIPESVRLAGEKADAIVTMRDKGEKPELDTAQAARPEPTPQQTDNRAQPALQAPAAVSDGKWEDRFRTLQGKYNAEVGRLREELANSASQIDILSEKLAESERTPAMSEMNFDAMTPQQLGLTEEEIEMLGPETVSAFRKMAMQAAKTLAEQSVAPIQHKVQSLEKFSEREAESRFYRELQRLVPDYLSLNTDQGFLSWLKEPEGLSGISRHDNMTSAANRHDADTVANYFRAYMESQQGRGSIAPATSGSDVPSTTDDQKEIITPDQVKAFYKQVNDGYYHGREDEAAQLEARIRAAAAEGRIRKR